MKKWAIIFSILIVIMLIIPTINATFKKNSIKKYQVGKQDNKEIKVKFGFIKFFIAKINGEYHKRTNNIDSFTLVGNIEVFGIGIHYGERYNQFGFHNTLSSCLSIDNFYGKCKNGKVNGMGFGVIDHYNT